MTKGKRECGCPPESELPQCHHELADVREKAAEGLTLDEIELAERRVRRMSGTRPEELERETPLPQPITVVRGGAPGSGKGK